jgi:hypothetical protein
MVVLERFLRYLEHLFITLAAEVDLGLLGVPMLVV